MFSKFHLYSFLLVLLLVFNSPVLLAQPSADYRQNCGLTIAGKITDHDTKEALVGATIVIEELNFAVHADAYGNYHFHHICEGVYKVKITYLGYETIQAELRLKNSIVKNFDLHQSATSLKSVMVTGERLPEQTSLGVSVLRDRELAATEGMSLGESLKRMTGVSSIQTGPTISKPVIHGMYGNRVLILNNGVRQEGQQWGTEHAPEIDPFLAGKLTVVKGAAGVRYGSDAIGGVVLVEPKPLRDSAGIGGELHLVGATNNRQGSASGVVEGNLAAAPAFSWRLQGTLKRAGNAKTPDYYLKNTGFGEQNFSATLGFKKERFSTELFYSEFHTKLGVLSAAHFGNLTDLQQALATGVPQETADFTYAIDRPYQQVMHRLLKSKTTFETASAGKLHFTYGYQFNERDEYDKHRPRNDAAAALNRPELHLELITYITELVWEHQRKGDFSGSIGVSTINQKNTYGGRFFIPFYNSFSGGVFALERWQRNKLMLEAGLRYDYKYLEIIRRERNNMSRPEYDFHNVSGTVGAIYDAGYHLTLSANAGTAWRAPNASELFSDGVHHGTASYEKGNPDLESEKALNTSVTLNYHSNRRLNGDVTLYHTYIRNYIYLAPQAEPILTIRGAFPAFAYEQVDAVFRGVDVNASYTFSERLSWESKAALVRTYNYTDNNYLLLTPPDRFVNTLRYESKGLFKNQRFGQSFLAVGSTFVRRQNRVPANSDFAAPPDGYFLLQAEAGTSFRVGRQQLEFGIYGQNLLNTVYRDYLNRFRYFADETGRNITFRLKIPLEF